MRAIAAAALLLVPLVSLWSNNAFAEIVVDGRIDEPAWERAQRFSDFVSVQPLTLEPAPANRRVEAFLLSTPAGIAVAIRAFHPPSVPRTRARMQRDGNEQVDRLNFMIDFNADARTGYGFTITSAGDVIDEIITNERSFKSDWDGDWQHAVAEFEGGYSAEWLVPWSIAAMSGSAAETRTVAVYFDRVIAATGERHAWPAASFTRPRFLSDFAPIEIEQYRQGLFAITPYGVLLNDLRDNTTRFKAGADLFWKPGGDHQFAATINPDFGQVESDQLVVNFSAVETFFTDKRPFFTENQSAFNVSHPFGDLFYTRRVGGPADDGSGAADIDYAVKADGRLGAFGYAVFNASEDGAAGRDFSLLRGTHAGNGLDLGITHTRAERPWLGRSAHVTAFDATWRPAAQWLLRPLFLHSDIRQGHSTRRGHGAAVVADWELAGPWRQRYFALWADSDLQINDLGFQQRNDFRHLEWETGYRQDHLPEASPFASHSWDLKLLDRRSSAGLPLMQTATLGRSSRRRDGGSQFGLLRWRLPAHDDLISRGNGPVRIQGGPGIYIERGRPRQGSERFGWYWMLDAFPNALAGHTLIAGVRPRFHFGEQLDIDLGLHRWHRSDWLLWQQGSEFGSFRARHLQLSSNLNWFIDERQELRVKLQSIAIDARALQARQLQADGRMRDSHAPLDSFRVRNLGFQIRYHYKLGNLSDVYAVYSRGGFALDEESTGLGSTFGDTFALRDDDQFLLKLAYRFDWLN
jgi:hypothetical protein